MKLRPYGNNQWRADAGIVLGKRLQKVFDRKKDAEVWLKVQDQTRRDNRIGIRHITQSQEQIALLAFGHLKKHGAPEEALLDAVKRFCTSVLPANPTSLGNALIAFSSDLGYGNRSPVYITQIGRQLHRFWRSFQDRNMHEVTSEDVQKWLETNCETAANRANRRRELRVFFSWAVKKKLISENPVDQTPTIAVDRGKPEILTVDQVKSALVNLKGEDRALFAIMVFAGLRPSEAEVIHWEDIHLDRGFLEAKRGVRADNRNVRLSDNLIAWLNPLRGNGLLFPAHTRRWRDRVQRAIAINAEPLTEWPQDVLRHSYGSYHLEKHQDAAKTAHEMGHRGNTQMLFRHYRDRVDPEAADAFWKIFPGK
jgi:integrase